MKSSPPRPQIRMVTEVRNSIKSSLVMSGLIKYTNTLLNHHLLFFSLPYIQRKYKVSCCAFTDIWIRKCPARPFTCPFNASIPMRPLHLIILIQFTPRDTSEETFRRKGFHVSNLWLEVSEVRFQLSSAQCTKTPFHRKMEYEAKKFVTILNTKFHNFKQ